MEFYIRETEVSSSSHFNRTDLSAPGIKIFFLHKNMFPIHTGNKGRKYKFEINFLCVLNIIVSVLCIDGYTYIALLNLSD